jgi:hypothetical protein
MDNIGPQPLPVKPGRADSVHTGRPDPPDVQAFRELAEARRRGDRTRLRELIAAMLRHGWVTYAVEPRVAGKAVR